MQNKKLIFKQKQRIPLVAGGTVGGVCGLICFPFHFLPLIVLLGVLLAPPVATERVCERVFV